MTWALFRQEYVVNYAKSTLFHITIKNVDMKGNLKYIGALIHLTDE